MAASAASGVAPLADHLGQPWSSLSMKGIAGIPCMFRGKRVAFICLEFRQDWDQLCCGLGMPYTNQPRFCWYCPCAAKMKYRKAIAEPFTSESYMLEIAKCRVVVHVNKDDAGKIFDLLSVDIRKDKNMRGVVLKKDVCVQDFHSGAVVQLRKYYRLECDGSVWDTRCSAADLHGDPPYCLTFWRKSADNNFMAYSWLLRFPGVEHRHLMIGDLHSLDLGVTPRILGAVFARVLRQGSIFGNETSAFGLEKGCAALTATMKLAMKGMRGKGPHKITFKSLGLHLKQAAGHLKCKGHQARSLLPFALKLLTPATSQIIHKGVPLRKVCLSLQKAYELMDTSPRWPFDSALLTKLLNSVRRWSLKAEVRLIPKFHLAQHMGHLSQRAGNPKCYSEYLDESHNRKVVKSAVACSKREFAARVLAKEALLCRSLRGAAAARA